MIGFFAFVIYGVIAKKLAEERSEGEPEDDSLSRKTGDGLREP